MKKLETDRVASDSPRRNRSAEGRGFATTAWAGLGHPQRPRWLWVTAAAIFAIGLLTKPASAQAPAAERWNFQGGPSVGVVVRGSALLDLGLRFAASRGSQVLDLRVSAFQGKIQKYAYLPPKRKWRGYEALIGLGWQPGLLGIGIRSGLMTTTTRFTDERQWGYVVEPHTALAVPLGSSFELRGDVGVQLVVPTNGRDLPGFIGKIRIGVERRLR